MQPYIMLCEGAWAYRDIAHRLNVWYILFARTDLRIVHGYSAKVSSLVLAVDITRIICNGEWFADEPDTLPAADVTGAQQGVRPPTPLHLLTISEIDQWLGGRHGRIWGIDYASCNGT